MSEEIVPFTPVLLFIIIECRLVRKEKGEKALTMEIKTMEWRIGERSSSLWEKDIVFLLLIGGKWARSHSSLLLFHRKTIM